MSRNIILVGSMGAGKTTLGKHLASRLGFDFIDTDQLVEERAGADIPWIFDVEGEEGFRLRETSALKDVLHESQKVIATGGGIVTRPENRQLLRNQPGLVFYLTASVEQLVKRTYKDKKRPLLQVDNPRARIKELFEQRDPLYKEVSDYIVVTDNKTLKTLTNEVLQLIDSTSLDLSTRRGS